MAPHSFRQLFFFALSLWSLTPLATSSALLRHEVEELSSSQPSPQPSPLQRRQAAASIPITGIPAFGVQPRLEIRELQQNADQWNIYLLGLARFQATNQSDELSWYRIAGIHGRPYVPWDNVQPAPGVYSPGYCTHLSNLFLTWHRAYTALYEQTLQQHIVEAVNSFPAGPLRQRYAAAALSWRTPYWDWAATSPAGQSVYPPILSELTVSVILPNGTATIANPLYSYQFHPVVENDFYFSPFAVWNETKRWPTSWADDAVSQNAYVGEVLDNNRVSFQDRLYNLFTNYNNFSMFSNEAWMTSSVSNADSIESIHDAIHSITGSNGHMTFLDYSAYDPLFWLHHGMIDRCFALWQALYNDSFVEPLAAMEQTFTTTVGEVRDETSPLYPFHSDATGDFWTSDAVRSMETFGYTYSDLGNGSISAVKSAINRLYGSSAGTSSLSKREVPGAAVSDEAQSAPEEVSDGKYQEYLANIVSNKFAVNGSYAIYVFMGDFEDQPACWPFSPNLVGTHAVFAALQTVDATSNPQLQRRQDGGSIQVTGSMPLTSMLLAKVKAGELACMDPPEVTSYLSSNLRWRVGMFDGTQVSVDDVANLTITVATAEVEPASASDQFPNWGEFTVLASITQSQPGGSPGGE